MWCLYHIFIPPQIRSVINTLFLQQNIFPQIRMNFLSRLTSVQIRFAAKQVQVRLCYQMEFENKQPKQTNLKKKKWVFWFGTADKSLHTYIAVTERVPELFCLERRGHGYHFEDSRSVSLSLPASMQSGVLPSVLWLWFPLPPFLSC